jgi:mannitol/fructose-specific phosphotransferase system IIA component (Ntr-type)
MTLADFTSPNLIIPRLRGPDTASVIQELGQALHREKRVTDWLVFCRAALNHEFMAGTDMGTPIALPHVRLPFLKEVSFAFGRSERPLVWGTKPASLVRLVFLLAVPQTDSTQYLQLVSGLTQLTKNSRLIRKLEKPQSALHVIEILNQIELGTKPPQGPARNQTPKP